ncbi:Phosphate-repressible phosphate permease pho-4 [Porphyridium purpureum]|uniref:Phosphate transporter n=1 Tax=Porphyridium purpureum TaxID=35688 RepID=A0A5J4YYK1_PORPP|nr:Phosphate-repressible phosphate permease pho-4 [Porphyridium purpureum]|eukprot:POR7429..scf208_2
METIVYNVEPFSGTTQMQPWIWVFACCLIASFLQGAAMGANDLANCFGTSVGAKVLTVTQACIAASIFITLGSMTIGSKVAKTVGKGIVNYKLFADIPQLFILGMLTAAISAGVWVAFATWLSMPVSTTHSIVGSVTGFGLVQFGGSGIEWWPGVGKIVISWVASPLVTGIFSVSFYLVAKYWFLRKAQQDESRLAWALTQQIYYMAIVLWLAFLTFLIFVTFQYDENAVGMNLGISFGVASAIAVVWIAGMHEPINAYLAKRGLVGGFMDEEEIAVKDIDEIGSLAGSVHDEENGSSPASTGEPNLLVTGSVTSNAMSVVSSVLRSDADIREEGLPPNDIWHPELESRFAFGQMVSACYEAISFGANDIGNASGTLIAVFQTIEYASIVSKPQPEYWALAYCTVGILVGLFLFGTNVMRTIGQNITLMTPIRGLSAELATAFSVLIASYLGIPVSTTHCSVGGVIGAGLCETKGYKKVNWKLLLKVFASWVFTLPVAMGLNALIYVICRGGTQGQWFVPPADVVGNGVEGDFNDYEYTCVGNANIQTCTVKFSSHVLQVGM